MANRIKKINLNHFDFNSWTRSNTAYWIIDRSATTWIIFFSNYCYGAVELLTDKWTLGECNCGPSSLDAIQTNCPGHQKWCHISIATGHQMCRWRPTPPVAEMLGRLSDQSSSGWTEPRQPTGQRRHDGENVTGPSDDLQAEEEPIAAVFPLSFCSSNHRPYNFWQHKNDNMTWHELQLSQHMTTMGLFLCALSEHRIEIHLPVE